MFSQNAQLFFAPPNLHPPSPGDYGVLHLLRRDICFCLGWDPFTSSPTSHPTFWPGGMAILAGIDLIAKFYAGEDTIGNVGPRFRAFITRYFQPLSTGDEETIYQLRNALLHSFGLYSYSRRRIYKFKLSAQRSPLIQHFPPDEYQIDLFTLHDHFENSIQLYVTDLDTNQTLQDNFMAMFPKYGVIHIG